MDEVGIYVQSLLDQGPRERGYLVAAGRESVDVAQALDDLWPEWTKWQPHEVCGNCSQRAWDDAHPDCATKCLAWSRRQQGALF